MAVGLLAGTAFAQNASDLAVSGVRLGENNGVTRFVLDLNRPTDYQIITLQNPYRVAITMPHLRWQLLPGMAMDRGVVKGFRYGSFENGTFRVVLDLKSATKITQARLLSPDPALDVSTYRLMVDMQGVLPAQFQPQKLGEFEIPQTYVAVKEPPVVVPAPKIEPRPIPKSAKPSPAPPEKKTIVLDAGHGGVDPGAIGQRKSYEKNITLQAVLELQRVLESKGKYNVVLTRPSDVFIKLQDRVKISRAAKADLFLSLHADHHPNSEVRGASVYTLSEKASDAESARLAEEENKSDLIAGYDVPTEKPAVSSILADLVQQETMNLSHFYGSLLVNRLKKASQMVDSPLRSAGFAVLKAPEVPSVLVEMGYLSNRRDEELLNKKEYRAELVAALAAAIDDYFDKMREAPYGMR